MSKYRFNISDYHAIENADILVDGITVLAGPNGSGKSTISKWLYYMVDVATRFDEYVDKGVNDEFKHSLQILARAIREIWGYRSSRSEILTLSANIDALKKEMYRQHSIEVMLQQAFRQLDRYLSREHMDPLGEWRNELDEQLTNGTAGSGALMQLFTYYGKNKDKNLSDEANWDKAIAHFLLERERAAAELKNRDEF